MKKVLSACAALFALAAMTACGGKEQLGECWLYADGETGVRVELVLSPDGKTMTCSVSNPSDYILLFEDGKEYVYDYLGDSTMMISPIGKFTYSDTRDSVGADIRRLYYGEPLPADLLHVGVYPFRRTVMHGE